MQRTEDAIRCDVLVLGGGPAGAVVAKGLAEAGYETVLISSGSGSPVFEGASERVVEGFRRAGCTRSLGAVGAWVPRRSSWNGVAAEANGEFLVERAALDAALLADAASAGVRVVDGRVARGATDPEAGVAFIAADGSGCRTQARFLVEARGRRAPRPVPPRLSGPPATALTRRWRLPSGASPGTLAASFEDGWAWLAVGAEGRASLQIVVSGARGGLPGRQALLSRYEALAAAIPELRSLLADGHPAGEVVARNANAVLAADPVTGRSIRVGDAAVAVDPLSGHGMFEAVSTALAALPAIRTLLERPQDAALARRFYEERVELAFLRHARSGRDFYAAETRWPETPFWRDRSAWPDREEAHPGLSPEAARVVTRPVVEDGFVVPREVVVTPDHPRGVWHVDGVALVPLLRFLGEGPLGDDAIVTRSAAFCRRPAEQVARALAWLRFRGLLVGAEAGESSRPHSQ